jgi:hypothetical protein
MRLTKEHPESAGLRKSHVMVPKLDQQRGYAPHPGILLCRSVAMKQGKKPATGQFMVQTRGQELRQITPALKEATA